ncbi:DNA mismatch repair protein MutS [Vallitalea okinawensis]|uniref:DNA mismatch repair protein MutS n=1 Tax=Vallitalea okinawensis TaxID=2078660 RepID=UPI000CFD5F37|nr:DNA mismatch repair protein MutS [Vallitalea okinawensis]
MAKLTPMMQQYMSIKEQHKDCLLFFRLGDFYEMFFDDAVTASRELEITLTSRGKAGNDRYPMCGVPFHSAENYVQRLIEKGYKVAICEQVSDPSAGKGIVEREVVRIVTPGTNINTDNIEDTKNNYLLCIELKDNKIGLAAADVTTGEFFVTEMEDEKKLFDELAKFLPSEVLVSDGQSGNSSLQIEEARKRFDFFLNLYPEWNFDRNRCEEKLLKHFGVLKLDGLGLGNYDVGIIAAGTLLGYLYETQKRQLNHLSKITPYSVNEFMMLDISTRRNLELTETLREKKRRGSLLWVLDKTRTAMGGRMLRKWIEQPLITEEKIQKRLDAVEELINDPINREELKEYLDEIYDMERLMGKVAYGAANGRDLIALRNSLRMLPHIKSLMECYETSLLKDIHVNMDELEDIHQLIDNSIMEEPPVTLREGRLIKDGYHQDVDKYRKASTDGKHWIAELEAKERELTGIKNLKIKYNKVFGYYLEVTKSYLNLVPDRFVRKQTLANAERYITPELKEIEDTVLGAEEKIVELEYQLFTEIRDKIAAEMERIQKSATKVARLDVIRSLANVAERQNFIKPHLNVEGIIDIKDGRHPVVEKMIDNDAFIPNNTFLNEDEDRLAIITGPNMAGKSTYMRQVALIVLMGQIGSFVPASEANISLVDRIFTRVGASDDLASGQSTFMVEMTEVSNILNNATKDSLLILDEIGRGTSTFDGLSIAWSVVEYISDQNIIGAKTLFATHYHELTELEGKISGVKNYCVTIKESGEDIIFLHKIKRGGVDHSYGIEVAKLAGLPKTVVERSKEILSQLNESDIAKKASDIEVQTSIDEDLITSKQHEETVVQVATTMETQLNLFDTHSYDLIEKIKKLNILEMTPMDAMQTLFDLHKSAKDL